MIKTLGVSRRRRPLRTVAVGLLLSPLFSMTASLAAAQHQQHAAHEHGHAELTVALQGQDLQWQVTVPAIHVLGFEHRPSTAAENQSLEKAFQRFSRPAGLIRLPAIAACQLQAWSVSLSGQHRHHARPSAEHLSRSSAGSREHDDLQASYRFRCQKPTALNGLRLMVFDYLPGLSEVRAVLLSQDRQRLVELSVNRPSFNLIPE